MPTPSTDEIHRFMQQVAIALPADARQLHWLMEQAATNPRLLPERLDPTVELVSWTERLACLLEQLTDEPYEFHPIIAKLNAPPDWSQATSLTGGIAKKIGYLSEGGHQAEMILRRSSDLTQDILLRLKRFADKTQDDALRSWSTDLVRIAVDIASDPSHDPKDLGYRITKIAYEMRNEAPPEGPAS